ncbi:hypothetical protein ABK040_011256 [Willaertia magna]
MKRFTSVLLLSLLVLLVLVIVTLTTIEGHNGEDHGTPGSGGNGEHSGGHTGGYSGNTGCKCKSNLPFPIPTDIGKHCNKYQKRKYKKNCGTKKYNKKYNKKKQYTKKYNKKKEIKGKVRRYYVAAEVIEWDYSPFGYNLFDGAKAPLPAAMQRSATTIGRKFKKAVFREYTDKTFKKKKKHPIQLGFLGPVFRAEVGDQIRILFKNKLTKNGASMHPHGVHYEKNGEGASYYDNTGLYSNPGDDVHPGEIHEYVWDVPERAGPLPNGPSSINWLYHSHAHHEGMETNAGLMGMFVVYKKGMLDEKRQVAKDVDKEWFVLPRVIDETNSILFEDNIQIYLNATGTLTLEQYNRVKSDRTSNQKHTISGYMFNNHPGLTAFVGEKIRWYVGALGNFDFHPIHWHGNTGIEDNVRRVDTILIGPGMNRILDMEADNPGTWLWHCHIDNHMMDGMTAVYTVKEKC